MVKQIILTGFVFCLSLSIQGQSNTSIYYDALFLKQKCYSLDGFFEHKLTLNAVLKNYYQDGGFDVNLPASRTKIKNNPFFGKYFPDGEIQTSIESPEPKFNPIKFSSIGNLDVTTIADGFAKFIVERTKKELQAAFFDRFIEEIKKDEYKDIQIIFPTTYSLVKRIPEDVYNYEKFLQALRAAFGIDMGSILPHLENVLKDGRFVSFFNNHLELKSICLTALYFGNGLQNNTHIGELIEKFKPENPDYKFSATNENVNTISTNAIRFIQEVSKSFRTAAPDSKEYWIPSDSIMLLTKDDVAFNIYLGLLYQKVNGIKVSNKDSLITYGWVMNKLNENGTKLKDAIESITNQIRDAQSQLRDFQSKVKKDRTINDYMAYFNSAVGVLDRFKDNDFVSYLNSDLVSTSKQEINFYWAKYSEVIEGTNAVLSIYNNIKDKNYSLAINNVRTLYQMRFDPEKANNDSDKNKVERIIDFLLDKGAFIASVAEAKNSTEVYNAIDAVAMPVGSARVKRLSSFNIAVNAYCGLFAGNEIIKGLDLDKPFTRFNSFGLTAPIGFTISKGSSVVPWMVSSNSTSGWSFSWFFSLIDLGAVAAYRFTNDSIAQVPTIQLKDIFSPGIFWSIGLPKCPLSVNFGAQLGPNLRKVHDTTNDYSNKTYVRYSVSVCVDLPLLNLYTKSR